MSQLTQNPPSFNSTLPPALAWLIAQLPAAQAAAGVAAADLTGDIALARIAAALAAAGITAELPGSMKMWPLTAIPAGWLLCDGSEYANATYPALAAALLAEPGNPWAGSDAAHFKVPDSRAMAPYGVNPGSSLGLGNKSDGYFSFGFSVNVTGVTVLDDASLSGTGDTGGFGVTLAAGTDIADASGLGQFSSSGSLAGGAIPVTGALTAGTGTLTGTGGGNANIGFIGPNNNSATGVILPYFTTNFIIKT